MPFLGEGASRRGQQSLEIIIVHTAAWHSRSAGRSSFLLGLLIDRTVGSEYHTGNRGGIFEGDAGHLWWGLSRPTS